MCPQRGRGINSSRGDMKWELPSAERSSLNWYYADRHTGKVNLKKGLRKQTKCENKAIHRACPTHTHTQSTQNHLRLDSQGSSGWGM